MQNADLLRRNLCVCFSQITAYQLHSIDETLQFTMEHTYSYFQTPLVKVINVFLDKEKKPTQLNPPGKPDYTQTQFPPLAEGTICSICTPECGTH